MKKNIRIRYTESCIMKTRWKTEKKKFFKQNTKKESWVFFLCYSGLNFHCFFFIIIIIHTFCFHFNDHINLVHHCHSMFYIHIFFFFFGKQNEPNETEVLGCSLWSYQYDHHHQPKKKKMIIFWKFFFNFIFSVITHNIIFETWTKNDNYYYLSRDQMKFI